MKYLTPLLSFVLIPLLITAPLSAQAAGNPQDSGNSPESQDLQIRVIAGDSGSVSVNSQASGNFVVEVTSSDGAPVVDAAVAVRLPDTEPTGVFGDGSHATVGYTDQSGRARLSAVKWGSTPGVVAVRVTAVKGTAHAGLLLEEKLLATSVPPTAPTLAAQMLTAPSPAAAVPAATLPASQPRVIAKPANIETATANNSAPTHPLTPAVPTLKPQPSVSVTSSVPPGTQSHSHKKWIVIAAIAAGAGAGLAFAGRGKSGSSSSPAPSLTIGSPTVSVGHP
jgi:hypothetical protein